jgi:hypothetical protein
MSERRIIGVRVHGDHVLAAIAPLGLALAAEAAVVVDLDPHAPPYPGERTVAELAAHGPSRVEMWPARAGVATVGAGDVALAEGVAVVERLASAWPAVVVRVGMGAVVPFPVVPVRPLWPGFLAPTIDRASVWQLVVGGGAPPGPGPVLPPPGRATVTALLHNRVPWRSRWVRAWRRVWELPWR